LAAELFGSALAQLARLQREQRWLFQCAPNLFRPGKILFPERGSIFGKQISLADSTPSAAELAASNDPRSSQLRP
jgi:hypothetical protein